MGKNDHREMLADTVWSQRVGDGQRLGNLEWVDGPSTELEFRLVNVDEGKPEVVACRGAVRAKEPMIPTGGEATPGRGGGRGGTARATTGEPSGN